MGTFAELKKGVIKRVARTQKHLKERLLLKEAIGCAIDECVSKDILTDVLVKHRTEVEGMLLTTFDKKMYEEAMKMDGREEGRKEEQANTERERQRADKAEERANELEMENKKLRDELARLKKKKRDD